MSGKPNIIEITINQLFTHVENGNDSGAYQNLRRNPILLNAKSKESHGAPLIQCILYQAQTKPSWFKLINEFIRTDKKYINKIDVSATDNEANTILHRAFWYAMKAKHPEHCKILTTLGAELIKKISGLEDFKVLLKIKNNHGESFLNNIYFINTSKLSPQQKQNHAYITSVVDELLKPYRNIQVNDNSKDEITSQSNNNPQSLWEDVKTNTKYKGGVYNFNMDFHQLLNDALEDMVSFDLIENPLILTTEGITMSATTWAKIEKSPITRQVFDKKNLSVNKEIDAIIKLFKTTEPASLYEAIVTSLKKQSIAEKNSDCENILLNKVYALLQAYHNHLSMISSDNNQMPLCPSMQNLTISSSSNQFFNNNNSNISTNSNSNANSGSESQLQKLISETSMHQNTLPPFQRQLVQTLRGLLLNLKTDSSKYHEIGQKIISLMNAPENKQLFLGSYTENNSHGPSRLHNYFKEALAISEQIENQYYQKALSF